MESSPQHQNQSSSDAAPKATEPKLRIKPIGKKTYHKSMTTSPQEKKNLRRKASNLITRELQAEAIKYAYSRHGVHFEACSFSAVIDAYNRLRPLLGEQLISTMVGFKLLQPCLGSKRSGLLDRDYLLTPIGASFLKKTKTGQKFLLETAYMDSVKIIRSGYAKTLAKFT